MVQIVINRRTGRKRKTNVVRDSKGKSRGEILDLSVVYNQPHRRGQKNPKSELLGYPLGRLRHEGLIDEAQLNAGNAWASMVRAYSRMIGLRVGSPKSGSLTEAVATGFYVWRATAKRTAKGWTRRSRSGGASGCAGNTISATTACTRPAARLVRARHCSKRCAKSRSRSATRRTRSWGICAWR